MGLITARSRIHTTGILLTLIIAIFNGVNSACIGNAAADGCRSGTHAIPCAKATTREICCAVCEPVVRSAPTTATLPPPVVVQQPPTEPPHEVAILPPVAGCPDWMAPIVNEQVGTCIKRVIGGERGRQPTIRSCQDLDALLSDIDTAQTYLKNSQPESANTNPAPKSWILDQGSFENKCPLLLKQFHLKGIEFKERRGCRSSLFITVKYMFGDIQYEQQQVPAGCATNKPKPPFVEIEEVFEFPTRLPTIHELEPSIWDLLDSKQQCMSDLPKSEPYTNKTILVGTDCIGGAVPVIYTLQTNLQDKPASSSAIASLSNRLRQQQQDQNATTVPPVNECINRKILTRKWVTFDPLTGEVCPNDSVSREVTIEDTIPPTFVESHDLSNIISRGDEMANYVYMLECYADLVKFNLEYTDNCDKTVRKATASITVIRNTTTTSNGMQGQSTSCSNSARADIVFTAADPCGNTIRETRSFNVMDTHPPTPRKPIHTVVRRKCRHHITPPVPLELVDNCPVNAAGDFTFLAPVAHQRFVFLPDRKVQSVENTVIEGEDVIDKAENDKKDSSFITSNAARDLLLRDYQNEAKQGGRVAETPVCENNVVVETTWVATDFCSIPVNITRIDIAIDDEPPIWISESLPPDHVEYQCLSDVVQFADENQNTMIRAKDDCDQLELLVYGKEERWGPSNAEDAEAFPECPDNQRIIRTWSVPDSCGNVNTYRSVIDVFDTKPPPVVPDFKDKLSKLCLSRSDSNQRGNNFICFPNVKDQIAKYLRPDNCKRPLYIDFISAETLTCFNDERIDSCQKVAETISRNPYNREVTYGNFYYSHNDTLCLSTRKSLLHQLKFEASDVCGNAGILDLSIYNPARSAEDKDYDPKFPTHPCDDRIIITTPDNYYNSTITAFGVTYMANRVDPKAIPRSVPSMAVSSLPHADRFLALVLVIVTLIAAYQHTWETI